MLKDTIKEKSVSVECLSIGYIYILSQEDEIVYVGMSMYDPIGRILCHIRNGKIFDRYTILTGKDFGTAENLFRYVVDYVEAMLIMEYKPKYNTSISNKYFVTSTWIKNRYKRRINIINKDIASHKLVGHELDGYIYYLREEVETMYKRERDDRE